jgi:hypothetical protein
MAKFKLQLSCGGMHDGARTRMVQVCFVQADNRLPDRNCIVAQNGYAAIAGLMVRVNKSSL